MHAAFTSGLTCIVLERKLSGSTIREFPFRIIKKRFHRSNVGCGDLRAQDSPLETRDGKEGEGTMDGEMCVDSDETSRDKWRVKKTTRRNAFSRKSTDLH
jgi:hypothetical protein